MNYETITRLTLDVPGTKWYVFILFAPWHALTIARFVSLIEMTQVGFPLHVENEMTYIIRFKLGRLVFLTPKGDK